MDDPNAGLNDLTGEVAALRARLSDLENAQPKRRLRWVALASLVLLAAGSAVAASGTCPNGLQYCFTANSAASAFEVNYNFSQLRDMSPEAWVSNISGSVQSTQASSVVTSVSVPAGSYVVSAKVYGISGAMAGNHTLLCSIRSSEGAGSLDFTNSAAGPSTYGNLSLLSATTLTAAGTLSLWCSGGPDAYSLYGIALVATKVGALH